MAGKDKAEGIPVESLNISIDAVGMVVDIIERKSIPGLDVPLPGQGDSVTQWFKVMRKALYPILHTSVIHMASIPVGVKSGIKGRT